MIDGPPIPEIQLFKKLTLKIQGQGHGWCGSSKLQCESNIMNILSTHIPLVPCQLTMSIRHPLSELGLFQYLTLKIKGQGHASGHTSKSQCEFKILSTHIPFFPCQSGISFLSYDFLKIWHWKSGMKVMGEVTRQSHNVGLTSYRLTSLSFHVNRASHS